MLLLFLLFNALVGVAFIISAVILFVIIIIEKSNGLSWSMAILAADIGLAFFGIPLALLFREVLPAGIAALLHLLSTLFVLVYRLAQDGHSSNPA